jgi:hypothetical protein
MPILSEYRAIESHLLIRITIPEYKATAASAAVSTILTFSDAPFKEAIVYDSLTYIGLGTLLNVTSTTSELRPTSSELTITISGVPNTSIAEIVNSKIKGCSVAIFRALYDPNNGGDALNINDGNVLARYRGFVNNYSLSEEYDVVSRSSKNALLLICKSSIDVLQNKMAGRLTNPTSNKRFFPNDLSMDRVPALQNTSFNFGAPK